MANNVKKIKIQKSTDSEGWFLIVNANFEYFDTWAELLEQLKTMGV